MLTSRKALLFAIAFLSIFLLLRQVISSSPDTSFRPAPSINLLRKTSPPKTTALSTAAVSPHLQTDTRPLGQRPLPDIQSRPLRARLAYYFPYEPVLKFPAYIWQTWRDTPGSGRFPDDWRPLEASWSIAHPGFVHEVITDDTAVFMLRHLYSAVPDVVEAYLSLPRAVLKADFFRYLILFARGGIYSDIDTGVLKPAMQWVPDQVSRSSYGLVIGIEADPDREDWADWYSRRIQFCQWTIQAKPGHPVLREIITKITEVTLERKKKGLISSDDVHDVVNLTGPAIWTDTIFGFFNDPEFFEMNGSQANITWRDFTGMTAAKKVGDVVVLPITSFSPGVEQMGAKDVDDPMAFVQHIFVGSWKPENERHIGE